MKFTTALGGFLGFIIGLVGGLVGGREPAFIVLQAGLACALGAVLFQWLHRQLLRCAREAIREKREARRRQSAAASAKRVSPAP